MEKFFKLTALTLVTCATTYGAFADYAVQVGAYAKPATANLAAARNIGEVYTRVAGSGLTQLRVGRFDTAAQASATLSKLRAAGYSDAFITRSTNTNAAGSMNSAVLRSDAPSKRPVRQRWEHVPEALRMKLVLLDGRPHIKDGDTFTPLEKY